MKEQQKNTHFRTWKSGKTWLYASAALVALAAGAGAVYATTASITLPPAADIYTGASTGTATSTTNFGGETHASASLSALFQKNIGHSTLASILGVASDFPTATPVSGAATVLNDNVTDPMAYFMYNHTAQAISAAASAGVVASMASAVAWENPTAANESLATVASNAATSASSLTQLIVGSLASLENEIPTYYSDYQAAITEYASNGPDASYASLMNEANSIYAQVDVWGGHSFAVSAGSVAVSAAGSSQAFSVPDVASAFHSAGMVYGLEGVQALVGAPAAPASGSTAAKSATGLLGTAISALEQMNTAASSAVDMTTGATTGGNVGELGLYAQAPIQISEGATFNLAQTSTYKATSSGSAFAGMSLGNGYDSLAAFYTDYYETAGSNGKYENLISNGVLNASASLSVSGTVDTSDPGVYPITYSLSIPSDANTLDTARVTVDVVVTGNSNVSSLPVYQLYKGASDHFLTTDLTRANDLVRTSGYTFSQERIAGYTPTSGTLVHNWYSPKKGHFFTTNATTTEKNRLKGLGYSEITSGSKLYSSTSNNAASVYVSYNKDANHFYSTSRTMPAGYGHQTVAFKGILDE